MLQNVYSVKDAKRGFGAPFVHDNDATAMRDFEDIVSRGNNIMGTHPQDFDLYKVGVFDTERGVFTSKDAPEFISAGFVADLAVKNGGKPNV